MVRLLRVDLHELRVALRLPEGLQTLGVITLELRGLLVARTLVVGLLPHGATARVPEVVPILGETGGILRVVLHEIRVALRLTEGLQTLELLTLELRGLLVALTLVVGLLLTVSPLESPRSFQYSAFQWSGFFGSSSTRFV